jgi:hypothetical protein
MFNNRKDDGEKTDNGKHTENSSRQRERGRVGERDIEILLKTVSQMDSSLCGGTLTWGGWTTAQWWAIITRQ